MPSLDAFDEDFVLMLQVVQDDLDLLLVLHIDLQIVLGARFSMAADHILSDHDERHQKDLN